VNNTPATVASYANKPGLVGSRVDFAGLLISGWQVVGPTNPSEVPVTSLTQQVVCFIHHP
jgi:hypothetical protein